VKAQDPGDCVGLAAITRVATVEVGEAARAHRERIATGQLGGNCLMSVIGLTASGMS
jgi:hypothetical protein